MPLIFIWRLADEVDVNTKLSGDVLMAKTSTMMLFFLVLMPLFLYLKDIRQVIKRTPHTILVHHKWKTQEA